MYEISLAYVSSDIAIYPKAPTGFQACFGEKLVHDSSEQWIINLKWDLPEGNYIRSYKLTVAIVIM